VFRDCASADAIMLALASGDANAATIMIGECAFNRHRDCFVALLPSKAIRDGRQYLNASPAKSRGPSLGGTSGGWMGPGFPRDSGPHRTSTRTGRPVGNSQ